MTRTHEPAAGAASGAAGARGRFDRITEALRVTYQPDGVVAWLTTCNSTLGSGARPIDHLAAGDYGPVEQAVVLIGDVPADFFVAAGSAPSAEAEPCGAQESDTGPCVKAAGHDAHEDGDGTGWPVCGDPRHRAAAEPVDEEVRALRVGDDVLVTAKVGSLAPNLAIVWVEFPSLRGDDAIPTIVAVHRSRLRSSSAGVAPALCAECDADGDGNCTAGCLATASASPAVPAETAERYRPCPAVCRERDEGIAHTHDAKDGFLVLGCGVCESYPCKCPAQEAVKFCPTCRSGDPDRPWVIRSRAYGRPPVLCSDPWHDPAQRRGAVDPGTEGDQ